VVGSTPVTWMSKHQGVVATSTHRAEFCAKRLATEEAITILVHAVNEPTNLFRDNLRVTQNASMPAATMQKKYTAVSFHRVRECVAAKTVEPHKIDGKDNFAEIFAKPVNGTSFKYHARDLMWKNYIGQ